MEADRVDVEGDTGAVGGNDETLANHRHDALNDTSFLDDDRVRSTTRHQRAVAVICAICEGLARSGKACARSRGNQLRSRQAEKDE